MWSVIETAKRLGVSEQRVRQLLVEGRIKGKKLGGTWVVLKLSYTRKKLKTKGGDLIAKADD